MADQSDVENVLVSLVAGALYPNGTGAASIPGPDCRVYRGWPLSVALDADLAAGRINVTVFPQGEPGRNTTRYAEQWFGSAPAPTLTAVVTTNSVCFGGSAASGQVAGIGVDNHSYVYRVQSGDTPALVAANLAALARADWIVQLSGTTLTVAGASNLLARVVTDVPVLQEIKRQEQDFRITCWCPTPETRDTTAIAIDQSLAAQHFIGMPDGTQARLLYRGTAVFDQSEDALLYRRDLLYTAEYPTTINAVQPAMLFGDLVLNAAQFTA